MSPTSRRQEEEVVISRLTDLQKQIGKKQSFENGVTGISSIVRDHLSPSASPALHNAIFAAVSRVATVLQTRYTMPGFWLAGLRLFEETQSRTNKPSDREHLKNYIGRAREHLHEADIPENSGSTGNNRRYLFEGHLTVEPEPPPPAWLVAQNVLTTLAASEDWGAIVGSSTGRENNTREGERVIPDLQELMNNATEFSFSDLVNNFPELSFPDLDNVIQASLQEIGMGHQKAPPASKEVVAKLPVVSVTEEFLAKLGIETECAVCREKLVVNDTMQELPCSHLFHPNCLKPWLDENNSCPVCRHELRTDDHAYESRKEREKEAEEERKGAANALRGGEYMYV